jgi:hypothetical protein
LKWLERIPSNPTAWLVATGTLGWFSKTAYRPMVSSSGFDDLGLHGVLPNFFWAAFLAFLIVHFSGSARGACLAAFAANAIYEFDQLREDGFEDALLSSAGRTFDPWDIVAAAAGCSLAYFVLHADSTRNAGDN